MGDYTSSTWNFAADGSGGTIVADPPASTDPGQTPIASHLPGLQIGDQFHFLETAEVPGGNGLDPNGNPWNGNTWSGQGGQPSSVHTVAELLSEGGRGPAPIRSARSTPITTARLPRCKKLHRPETFWCMPRLGRRPRIRDVGRRGRRTENRATDPNPSLYRNR